MPPLNALRVRDEAVVAAARWWYAYWLWLKGADLLSVVSMVQNAVNDGLNLERPETFRELYDYTWQISKGKGFSQDEYLTSATAVVTQLVEDIDASPLYGPVGAFARSLARINAKTPADPRLRPAQTIKRIDADSAADVIGYESAAERLIEAAQLAVSALGEYMVEELRP